MESLKRELGDQIVKDFEAAMAGESPMASGGGNRQLAEACLVVSVLEPRVKRSLISWFLGIQMKEYTIIFSSGEDDAWLDRVDRRYNWLKKHLIEFEERFGPLFPPDWEMSERIAAEFCRYTCFVEIDFDQMLKRVTRAGLAQLLSSRQQEVSYPKLTQNIHRIVQIVL